LLFDCELLSVEKIRLYQIKRPQKDEA